MPGVQSAAYAFLVPCGVAHDPSDALGSANLLSELVTRGAGERSSRQLAAALDNLGLQRSESAETFHTAFYGATVSANLSPALRLLAEIVRQPHLNDEQLEYCKAGILQEIKSIEDDPAQKLFVELRRVAFPSPIGQPVLGEEAHVQALDRRAILAHYREHFHARGSILGVAGAVDFASVRDTVERLFGDWESGIASAMPYGPPDRTTSHLVSDKAQTHLGIAYRSVDQRDPDYFNAHGAVGVLSGGMSARLFTEVRERRGLCYTVSASLQSMRDVGFVLCHAGTTNDRAAETLDVILRELERLPNGIADDEVQRVRAGLKSSLIMQEESSSARASILAHSWFNLGRVRTVDEVAREIERITPSSILAYLERYPPKDFTIVTLGPQPLEASR